MLKQSTEYRDPTLSDIPELKKMRDSAANYALNRDFKRALESLQDLKAYLLARHVHPSFFNNILNETIGIIREVSEDKMILVDFEFYFKDKWRKQ